MPHCMIATMHRRSNVDPKRVLIWERADRILPGKIDSPVSEQRMT